MLAGKGECKGLKGGLNLNEMKAISAKSKLSSRLRDWSGQDTNGLTWLLCLQHQFPSSKPTLLLTESVISQPRIILGLVSRDR